MSDFGLLISEPGVSVYDAKPQQLVLNSKYAQLKIDTQNPNGFASITLVITTDPPEPSGTSQYTYTIVAKYKHGYTYIPEIESLFYVTTPPPGSTGNQTQTYFMDRGQLMSHASGEDGAFLYSTADATYVYYIIEKYKTSSGSSNLLTGTNVDISTHVFVDDIGV